VRRLKISLKIALTED